MLRIDDIHAYRRDFMASFVDVLDFGGLFVFLGVKSIAHSPLHVFYNLLDLNMRPYRNPLKNGDFVI